MTTKNTTKSKNHGLWAFSRLALNAAYGTLDTINKDSAVMYVGPNHYNAERNGYVQSLDAAKVTYSDDTKAFTVIAGRVNNSFNNVTGAPAAAAGDNFGIFGALKAVRNSSLF